MITRILLFCFLMIISNTFGQTIREYEYDLSHYYSSGQYGDKIDTAKKLQEIDPFNYRASEYICRYYYDRKIDFVSIYFDNLISKFPQNIEPFLLRAELLYLEVDFREKNEFNKQKVAYLKQGLKIDLDNDLIIFKLAEVYYVDFIFPLEKEKDFLGDYFEDDTLDSLQMIKKKVIKKSTFEHSADSSLRYFYQYGI